MEKNFKGEQWKEIIFNFDFINRSTIEISDFGRVRTFNKISKGNIINGSMINGYKIIRLKFFTARDESVQDNLNYLKRQVQELTQRNHHLQKTLEKLNDNDDTFLPLKKKFDDSALLLKKLKKIVSQKFNDDLRTRTIHYHALIHRLVAEYFINKPSAQHTVVAHLDYDKLNNYRGNLKWMAPRKITFISDVARMQLKARVILMAEEKEFARSTKLSVTKVMLLKRLLIEGKPVPQLVKQFKITGTQIARIKKGENWAEVQPAPENIR